MQRANKATAGRHFTTLSMVDAQWLVDRLDMQLFCEIFCKCPDGDDRRPILNVFHIIDCHIIILLWFGLYSWKPLIAMLVSIWLNILQLRPSCQIFPAH